MPNENQTPPRLTFDAWAVVFERSLTDDEELLTEGVFALTGLCARMVAQFKAEWAESGGLIAPIVSPTVRMDADSYYLDAVVYLPACDDVEAALSLAIGRIQTFYDDGGLSGSFVISGRVSG
jgi:hypothetical protein